MNKIVEDKRIDTCSSKDAYLINGKKEKKEKNMKRKSGISTRVGVL